MGTGRALRHCVVIVVVSFSLALYVSVKSRGRTMKDVAKLGMKMIAGLALNPSFYFSPPAKKQATPIKAGSHLLASGRHE